MKRVTYCPFNEQVLGHLKDAFFLMLDDMQLWVVDGLDSALDQLEHLTDAAWAGVRQLQDTQVGRAATSGLDDVLTRLEDATAYYLPLPPTLREYRGIVVNFPQGSHMSFYLLSLHKRGAELIRLIDLIT